MTHFADTCPQNRDPGQLAAYVEGELDDTAAVELEDHLTTCAACASELSAIRNLDALLMAHSEVFHPDDEDLFGFVQGAADPGGTIARHLETCVACQSDVEILRSLRAAGEAGRAVRRGDLPAQLVRELDRVYPLSVAPSLRERTAEWLDSFRSLLFRGPVLAVGTACALLLFVVVLIPMLRTIERIPSSVSEPAPPGLVDLQKKQTKPEPPAPSGDKSDVDLPKNRVLIPGKSVPMALPESAPAPAAQLPASVNSGSGAARDAVPPAKPEEAKLPGSTEVLGRIREKDAPAREAETGVQARRPQTGQEEVRLGAVSEDEKKRKKISGKEAFRDVAPSTEPLSTSERGARPGRAPAQAAKEKHEYAAAPKPAAPAAPRFRQEPSAPPPRGDHASPQASAAPRKGQAPGDRRADLGKADSKLTQPLAIRVRIVDGQGQPIPDLSFSPPSDLTNRFRFIERGARPEEQAAEIAAAAPAKSNLEGAGEQERAPFLLIRVRPSGDAFSVEAFLYPFEGSTEAERSKETGGGVTREDLSARIAALVSSLLRDP